MSYPLGIPEVELWLKRMDDDPVEVARMLWLASSTLKDLDGKIWIGNSCIGAFER